MRFTALFIAAAALRITVAAPAPPPTQQSHTGGTEAAFPPSGLPGKVGSIASAFPLNSNLGANGADLPVAGALLKSAPFPSKVTNPSQQARPQKRQQLPNLSAASLASAPIVGQMLSPPAPAAPTQHKKRQLPNFAPFGPSGGLPDITRIATPNSLPALPVLTPQANPGTGAPNGAGAPHQKRATGTGEGKDNFHRNGPVAPTAGNRAGAAAAPVPGRNMGSLQKAEQVVHPEVKGTVKNADEIISPSKFAAAAEKAARKVKGAVQQAEGATPGFPATAAGIPGLKDDQNAVTATSPAAGPEQASPAQTAHSRLLSKVSSVLNTGAAGTQ